MYRELDEELGVRACIDFIIGVTHFYRGDARPENELLGVQFCCSLVDDSPEINLSWEHAGYRWVTAQQAEELFPAEHWLGQTIRRAEAIRALSPSELLEYHRVHGFEL
jgi:8-oxo-dGTP pyrophosphatase MutT (NUDIX family)